MKELFCIIFILYFSIPIKAGSWSLEKAFELAALNLGTDNLSMAKENDTYCIIQCEDTTGYIIISKNPNTPNNILGLSLTSRWKGNDMPPILISWLDSLKYNTATKQANIKSRNTKKEVKTSISPLLTCHWHQQSPYNDLSPVITEGNIKTVAGCVAIAAAQIVYYWRNYNPEFTLYDTPTYPYGKAPVVYSIPKGSPNNWNLILDTYNNTSSVESRASVAQLCYVIGTTSYLNYGSSTGGSIRDASNAIYIQYRLLSEYTQKSDYSQDEWEKIIYNDLRKGYPIMCSGTYSDSNGHAFVLDGYDSTLNLYHFNFGWGGDGDGYYTVDDDINAMGGFSMNQAIVYDIHPKTYTPSVIQTIDNENKQNIYTIYDINGRKLEGITEHGIYIIKYCNEVKKIFR